MELKLIKASEDNFKGLIKLKSQEEDLGYIDSAVYSLAECYLDYDHMEAFAIYDGEILIGFTSLYFKENFGQIVNFFIGDDYQNKSYGRRAVSLICQMFKNDYGVSTISVGVFRDNTKALAFLNKLGFLDTGNIEGDYKYLRKALNKIFVSNDAYLSPYFPAYNISLKWYKDKQTVKMVDNSNTPYDMDQLKNMYTYLDKNRDLFYIVYKNELVGDCAIFDDNMVAIVISNDHRGDNLGSKVLKRLISYAREKKLLYLKAEIYEFNHISRNLFTKFGFESIGDNLYALSLKD